jgi:hypothetical protein
MHWRISAAPDCLRAELAERETAAETREFLRAVAAAAMAHGLPRVLISVRSSKPLFKVDDYGIEEFFRLMAAVEGSRVSLLADTEEVRTSHEYIEVLARQCGARVRSFRSEVAALQWLRAAPGEAP